MKKKIGDLTLREARKICEKYEACYVCPYKFRWQDGCLLDIKHKDFDKFQNDEVEAE